MSVDVVIVLVVLTASFILFIKEWLRADLVAMLVLLSLVVSGLVDTKDAIAGFSSPAIITVCSIYVISAGLYKTGVASILGRRIMGLAGKSERKLIVALMVVTAVMSFFMNTVGIVALMLPVVMDIARSTGRAPSRLLMPLAFGALLGGLTTPFATLSNILVSSTMQDFGLEPFHILDFAPIGSVAAITGILFLAIVAPLWLPSRDLEKSQHLPSVGELKSQYHLHDRMFVLKLPTGSVLRGKTLQGTRLGSALGLHVVAILRNPEMLLAPSPATLLQEGDRLLIQGSPDQLKDLESWRSLVMRERGEEAETLLSQELEFDEFEIPDGSNLIGQNIVMLDFRNRFGSNLLAVRRDPKIEKRNLRNWVFESGDILLLECTRVQGMMLREFTELKHQRTCSAAEVRREYQIEERLFVAEISENSRLANQSLGESRFGEALNFTTLEIIRGEQHIFNPQKNEVLLAGDQLVMNGQRENLDLLRGIQDLELEREVEEDISVFESETVGIEEAILSPRSNLAGKTPEELKFRQSYGLNLLGLWRNGTAHTTGLGKIKLEYGDAILLYGTKQKLAELATSRDFFVLSEAVQPAPEKEKSPYALVAMLAFIITALTGWMPIPIAALIGAIIMILSRCVKIEEVYSVIDFKTVVLIAGMTPMALALEKTGAAAMAANQLVQVAGGFGPMVVIGTIFLCTSIGTCFLPAAPLVLIMVPIAYNSALELEISPHTVMMALALAAAGSFNSPIAHPSNMMIMGPGGYRFTDFLKIGIPLTIVVFIIVMIFLPIFWPLAN